MFLEYTYKIDDNGNYIDDFNSQGIYISNDLIKYIEFTSLKEKYKNE
jgi:hypothetical protein